MNPSLLAKRSCQVNLFTQTDSGVVNPYIIGTEYWPWDPEPFGDLICSPSCGLPGTTVTLTGSNFGGTTEVLFNGQRAQFTPGLDPDKEIVATVPPHATTGPITVITPLGNITSLSPFTVPVLLGMALKSNEVQLSWCADDCDLVLETTTNLNEWQLVPTSPSVGPQEVLWKGPRKAGAQFFRLRQPAKATAP